MTDDRELPADLIAHPHLRPIASGWEQVADYALDWALRHARQSSPA